MNFGIIGYGRFGSLWAQLLAPFGTVRVFDRALTRSSEDSRVIFTSLAEAVAADIVFPLVPISNFADCCREIAPFLKKDALLADCCSVKIHPAKAMRDIFGPDQPLLALHPLFGPDSVARAGIAGQKIVICSLGDPSGKEQFLSGLFASMGLIAIHATPESHDRQMAHSQSLVHFLGRGLAALDLSAQELATPDYQALLRINGMVVNDSWQLFFDMHSYNPFAAELRQKLLSQLSQLDQDIMRRTQNADFGSA